VVRSKPRRIGKATSDTISPLGKTLSGIADTNGASFEIKQHAKTK
jgi:hypothetical protein